MSVVRRERSSGPKSLKLLFDGRVQTRIVRRKVAHTLQLGGDAPRKIVFLTRLIQPEVDQCDGAVRVHLSLVEGCSPNRRSSSVPNRCFFGFQGLENTVA